MFLRKTDARTKAELEAVALHAALRDTLERLTREKDVIDDAHARATKAVREARSVVRRIADGRT